MSDSMGAMLADLLMRGADDWVTDSEVAEIAAAIGGGVTQNEVRELSLALIRAALERELVEVGDVTEEDGFVSWGLPVEAALARIEREWLRLGEPTIGDIFWLCNTAEGDRRAEELYADGPPADESW